MKNEQDDSAENSGENPRKRRGMRRESPQYQWKKGQPSPNPGGRPRKAPRVRAGTREANRFSLMYFGGEDFGARHRSSSVSHRARSQDHHIDGFQ
jgi:hypothetical protein